MARRLVPALLLLFTALTSCGAVPGSVASGQLYTVTTSVMQKPGEAPHACSGVPLPFPPIGCGGPDIHGLDLATMRGVTTYGNGVRATRIVRLVGTWDRGVLVLTRAPEAASPVSVTAPHTCDQPYGFTGNGETPPMMQRLLDDSAMLRSRGIMLLQFGPCDETTYFALVPVADSETIAYMSDRYGPTLKIYGWLQPVER